MATKQSVKLLWNNDPTISLSILRANGDPYDLTGKRVEFLVKDDDEALDSAAMFVLSSDSGSIAITDITGGLAVADFEGVLTTHGTFWYDAYVSDAADADIDRETFNYGVFTVIPV